MKKKFDPPRHVQIRREIQEMKAFGREIRATPELARAFLLKAGFITKANKLHPRYR